MSPSISKTIRKRAADRAAHRCEYCRVHENDSFLPFQIDHIVSLKHGGGNEIENLAYACPHCNQHKGTDLTTYLESYQDIVTIFNPRIHDWPAHFSAKEGEVISKSRIGEATIKLLRLNEPERLIIRKILMETGSWPG